MSRPLSQTTQVVANDILNEGIKIVSDVYGQSVETIHDIEDNVKEYSEKLVAGARQNPFSTALIVGGISALLTFLIFKR